MTDKTDKKADRFWETFWLTFLGITVLSVASSGALFFSHIQGINSAAVGVSFDASKDPFENGLTSAKFALNDGYVYRNALPLGVKHWAWDASVDWVDASIVYEGSAALHATFLKPWAGLGINGFSISTSKYNSISLAVYPDAQVEDLYIDLYDARGTSLVRQSLGWYTQSGQLVPNQWQYISVPLQNLLGSSTAKTIAGVSISTKNAGTAHIDAIEFDPNLITHELWVMPEGGGAPFNPFATSTPTTLPYTADFGEQDFSRWYSYYGSFASIGGAFAIGPKAPTYNDSVVVYRGGRFWSDYQVKTTVDWGLTSVFSLLVRMTDSSNFVSCAFSYYGQTLQIYQVKDGVSKQLGQTPTLAIPNEKAWENVSLGASVQGNRVSCYLNGSKELSAEIPDLQRTGSIGIEAWDANAYSSPHMLKMLQVTPLVGE